MINEDWLINTPAPPFLEAPAMSLVSKVGSCSLAYHVQAAFPSPLIQGFLGSPTKYSTCTHILVSGSAAGRTQPQMGQILKEGLNGGQR